MRHMQQSHTVHRSFLSFDEVTITGLVEVHWSGKNLCKKKVKKKIFSKTRSLSDSANTEMMFESVSLSSMLTSIPAVCLLNGQGSVT